MPSAMSEIPAPAALAYTARFSEPALTALRAEGDPLADAVVAGLSASGSLKNFHDLLGEVRARSEREGGVYQAFLDHAHTVPDWADFGQMVTGQRMIAAFPLHMGIALLSGSLVGGAVFAKMALITAMTGMFGGDANRRLDETAAMVLGMAFPHAIEPGQPGHELLVRVRLLHAAIRHYLVATGRFKHPSEVPINQQDLAITLALFGYVNVRSLARSGIAFTDAQLASYNLLWRYAGHVLGIRDDLLPRSIDEQKAFFLASLKHQGRPDKMALATKHVLDTVARTAHKQLPLVPFPVAQKFLHQICRHLSGNDYVTGMQIEDAGEYWAIKAFKALGAVAAFTYQRVPFGEALLYEVGARGYRRALSRMARSKDQQGTYRVRTVEHAALRSHAA